MISPCIREGHFAGAGCDWFDKATAVAVETQTEGSERTGALSKRLAAATFGINLGEF